jgi:hypothetical protein
VAVTWVLEEEYSELDTLTVEAEYRLAELLRKLLEKIRSGRLDFSEELRVLEEVTSPLINYPCKLYFELLLDELRRVGLGLGRLKNAEELVGELLTLWPSCPAS